MPREVTDPSAPVLSLQNFQAAKCPDYFLNVQLISLYLWLMVECDHYLWMNEGAVKYGCIVRYRNYGVMEDGGLFWICVQTYGSLQTSLKSLRLWKLLDKSVLAYWALLGPFWSFLVLLGSSGSIFTDFTGPYLALMGLTEPYSALLGLTAPYLALLSLTLSSLTGPYLALLSLTRP